MNWKPNSAPCSTERSSTASRTDLHLTDPTHMDPGLVIGVMPPRLVLERFFLGSVSLPISPPPPAKRCSPANNTKSAKHSPFCRSLISDQHLTQTYSSGAISLMASSNLRLTTFPAVSRTPSIVHVRSRHAGSGAVAPGYLMRYARTSDGLQCRPGIQPFAWCRSQAPGAAKGKTARRPTWLPR